MVASRRHRAVPVDVDPDRQGAGTVETFKQVGHDGVTERPAQPGDVLLVGRDQNDAVFPAVIIGARLNALVIGRKVEPLGKAAQMECRSRRADRLPDQECRQKPPGFGHGSQSHSQLPIIRNGAQ
jgi:hypothetical protein